MKNVLGEGEDGGRRAVGPLEAPGRRLELLRPRDFDYAGPKSVNRGLTASKLTEEALGWEDIVLAGVSEREGEGVGGGRDEKAKSAKFDSITGFGAPKHGTSRCRAVRASRARHQAQKLRVARKVYF